MTTQDPSPRPGISRRGFLTTSGVTLAAGMAAPLIGADKPIQGFDETDPGKLAAKPWQPVSERKIRVGIAGYGVCRFGAAFGFQDHPNATVVAVTDLDPERCAGLAKACRCPKSYPALEELVKDDSIEAVFLATDAPSHARHAILCLDHGKHVACAVPAVFGSLEQAEQLHQAVKRSGRTYMMFETSVFREDCHAMRAAYQAGALGRLIYSEGQYYHYSLETIGSYKDWRLGLPPMWYPTHSSAYYVGVTGGSFTEVSCLGFKGSIPRYQPDANVYQNPFDSEIALFRTSEGGASRISVCWGTRGSDGEYGHVRGEKGCMEGTAFQPADDLKTLRLNLAKPQLPPGMDGGGHGGSHAHLTDEFLTAILRQRAPLVDVVMALNLTVPGIVAHQSALKDGERMKVPQYA